MTMRRQSIVQNLIIAIIIFAFISILILYIFDDFFLRAIFLVLAFGALLRVLYQKFRPPGVEVVEKKEPEGLDRTIPKKGAKGPEEVAPKTDKRAGVKKLHCYKGLGR